MTDMENKEIETCKLLYNTERVRLFIPEYGRNVQKMVNYLKTIDDREKRNEQARAIIKVMEQYLALCLSRQSLSLEITLEDETQILFFCT